MAFIYLASPYTHENPVIVMRRYDATLAATHALLASSAIIFSPIVHCHLLAQQFTLPNDFTYWKRYNEAMLAAAAELLVFQLDGWKTSKGVMHEIAFAEQISTPVLYISPRDLKIEDVSCGGGQGESALL